MNPSIRHFCALFFLTLLLLLTTSCAFVKKERYQHHFDRGVRYFEQAKFSEAYIEFQNAVQQNAGAWEPHYYLGMLASRRNRWQEAFAQLNTAIRLEPAATSPRLELAELLMANRQMTEARAQIADVQSKEPDNLRAQLLAGKVSTVEQDFARAMTEFNRAKQMAPQDPLTWSSSGVAEIGTGQYEAAEADFRKAIQLDAGSAEGYRNLANILRLRGREPEAEALLIKAAAENPRNVDIVLVLADFWFQKQRLDAADALFTTLQQQGIPNVNEQLGDFWAFRNQLPRAIPFYEASVNKQPDVTVQKKLISAYLPLRRTADAEKLTAALIAKDPNDVEARAFRGALDYLHGDNNSAKQLLQAAVKDDPSSPFANYYLGLSLMSSGDAAEAQKAFQECLHINPRFIEAHLRIAELALVGGNWTLAIENSQAALALDSKLWDAYLILAQAEMQKGDLSAASNALAKAQEWSPLPAEYYEVAAQLEGRQKKVSAAIQDYEKALNLSKHPIVTLMRYTDFLVSNREAKKAIDRVRMYNQGAPDNVYGYELLARLYQQQRDFDNAEATCRELIRRFPDHWNPHSILADILRQRGRDAEALAEYDEAIHRNPHQASLFSDAGRLLLERKEFARAKTYYDAAIREAPASWEARKGMARLYAEDGENLDQALSLAQGLKNEKPTDPYVSDTLGWIYYRKHLFGLAVNELHLAAQALPENAEVQFHLGMAYTDGGQSPEGRQALQRALKMGLGDPTLVAQAQSTLQRLTAD